MNNESKTLFIPLYGKALMSRENFYKDEKAEEIINSVGSQLSNVDKSYRLAVFMTMRAMQHDEIADKFIAENPDGIVITLGCGLDSRIIRIKNHAYMWYDLDFPDVIDIRSEYYKNIPDYKMISSSATHFEWLDKIKYDNQNVLVIAEGISMYLSENDMKNIFKNLKKHFKNCLFVFDAYSHSAAKISKYKNPVNAVNAKIDFSMDNPEIFENKSNGITCCIDNDIIQDKYISLLDGFYKIRFKFMKKAGSAFYRIYGYQIVQ